MTISQTKTNPWQKRSGEDVKKLSDNEINEKYEQGERRLLLEMNREKLPSFAESLNKPNYVKKRPFYQRRDRWDAQKQSRLIESFLMNIPVPPLILYETSYNSSKYRTKNNFFSGKNGSKLYLERLSGLCSKSATVQGFQRFCPVLR